MMDMPKGGVKELEKSRYGREYLNKLRKQYARDILQPGDPMFQKVYGDQVKKSQETLAKQKIKSQEEWNMKHDMDAHDKSRAEGSKRIL